MDYNSIPEQITVSGDAEDRDVIVNGKFITPSRSQKIINHSPDGFNWGYAGSGPAQLALAILLQFMPQEEATSRYQRFKFRVVAAFPKGDFNVTVNLRQVILELDREKEAAKG